MSSKIKRYYWNGDESRGGELVLHSHHEAEVARLRAEVEAYRQDAERYRWLRNKANDSYRTAPMVAANPMDRETIRLIHSDELDAAIDTAMGEPE